jgi:hypothetical protein
MQRVEIYQMEDLTGGGFWRCALGTAGSAGLGFLAGSGYGTLFTLGPIGVTGAALGTISGAFVGAATFC